MSSSKARDWLGSSTLLNAGDAGWALKVGEGVDAVTARAVKDVRDSRRPVVLVAQVERLTHHTNADDESVYRDEAERAAARGATTLQGLGMLVNQALTNARLWTGRELDAGVMRRALEESLRA